MKQIVISIIFICVVLPFSGEAKSYSFKHLTVENGLSNNLVNAIYKDSYGFVWFGTLDGLDRYDGIELRHYAAKFPCIINNVYAITEDHSKNLWVGSGSGLFCYDRNNDNFQKIKIGQNNTIVHALVSKPDSVIVVGSSNGLYLINTVTFSADYFSAPLASLNHLNDITGIAMDEWGNFWVSTKGGLLYFEWENRQFTFYKCTFQPAAMNNTFTSICLMDHSLYMGTPGAGLIIFDTLSKTFVKGWSVGNDLITNLQSDDQGRLLIGTNGGGLKIVDPATSKVESIETQSDNPASISSNSIYSLLIDDAQRYWIGTYSGGVSYSCANNSIFQVHSATNSTTGATHSVRSFYFENDGALFIGTRNGLIHVDRKGKQAIYKHNPKNIVGLRSNIILKVFPFEGDILIGTYGGGVSRFSMLQQKIVPFIDDESFLYGNNYAFELDKSGNLWIASFNGIYLYDSINKKLTNFNSANSPLENDEVFSLKIDSKGRLWVGTMNGVSVFVEKGGGLIRFKLPTMVESNKYKVNYIYEDRKGDIWICTERGGLFYVDQELNSAKNYLDVDGLPDNSVCAIIDGKNDDYWISTLKGFCNFNDEKQRFVTFSMSDGLPGLVFNPASIHKAKDGIIWLGNEKGLVYFSSGVIGKRLPVSKVQLTDFYLFGKIVEPGEKSVLKQAIEYSETIELSDRQNSIGFRFIDLNYINPVDNHYLVKLEGFDKEWRDNGYNNTVFYEKLKPGRYTFRVKNAINLEDANTSNEREIGIIIKKSILRSPLIIIVLIIIAAEVIFLLFNYIKSLRRIVRKMIEKPEKIEKYRFSKLSDQQSELIVQNIKANMENKKPYLNPDLKLADLADDLNIPPHEISQVINQFLNQNFTDFINHYRVEEVKKRMVDEAYSKYTLMAIAENCGFNSKTSFYRIFKKDTGVTPAEYLKNQFDIEK
jgi:ligand-binding sensor domain-containing protein/AraC-like DNA-binding protein